MVSEVGSVDPRVGGGFKAQSAVPFSLPPFVVGDGRDVAGRVCLRRASGAG